MIQCGPTTCEWNRNKRIECLQLYTHFPNVTQFYIFQRLMMYNLKSEAYTYDFTSIILMEPTGIPLKTMDELFNVYSSGVGKGVPGQNILNAPQAAGRELEAIEKMRKIKIPRCFGIITNNGYLRFLHTCLSLKTSYHPTFMFLLYQVNYQNPWQQQ